jgi:hypothetical protein
MSLPLLRSGSDYAIASVPAMPWPFHPPARAAQNVPQPNVPPFGQYFALIAKSEARIVRAQKERAPCPLSRGCQDSCWVARLAALLRRYLRWFCMCAQLKLQYMTPCDRCWPFTARST